MPMIRLLAMGHAARGLGAGDFSGRAGYRLVVTQAVLGVGALFVVRAFSKLSCGPCSLSSCAGGRWGSPMARGPWGSLSLVFAALSVCGALGGSCDRSLCSSVADDCCAPLSIGEAATCRNGYVAQRTGSGCAGYGEGDYTCCSSDCADGYELIASGSLSNGAYCTGY